MPPLKREKDRKACFIFGLWVWKLSDQQLFLLRTSIYLEFAYFLFFQEATILLLLVTVPQVSHDR